MGQVALAFGANDMGSTMIEENVVRAAGVSHAVTVEEIVRSSRPPALRPCSATRCTARSGATAQSPTCGSESCGSRVSSPYSLPLRPQGNPLRKPLRPSWAAGLPVAAAEGLPPLRRDERRGRWKVQQYHFPNPRPRGDAAAASRPDDAKGLKTNAVGMLSSVVIGIASTAPAYSLAVTLGLVVVVAGVGSSRRRSCSSRSSR